jgi:hypothetical protein
MKGTGPVDELIAKTPDWRGATLARLREIVRDADPTMVEDVKWRRPSNPNGSAVWEHHGIVCVGIILKQSVRLSFFAGSSLSDPSKLFNAQLNGKSRAIDFSQDDDEIDRRALTALIRSAVAHNVAKARPAAALARLSARTRRPRRTAPMGRRTTTRRER